MKKERKITVRALKKDEKPSFLTVFQAPEPPPEIAGTVKFISSSLKLNEMMVVEGSKDPDSLVSEISSALVASQAFTHYHSVEDSKIFFSINPLKREEC